MNKQERLLIGYFWLVGTTTPYYGGQSMEIKFAFTRSRCALIETTIFLKSTKNRTMMQKNTRVMRLIAAGCALIAFMNTSSYASTESELKSLQQQTKYFTQKGQYVQAIATTKKILAIRESTSGQDHLDTANALINLALLYQDQGQYAQAEPLYKRSLAIREKALGPDHTSVATSLNSLASVYKAQGQFSYAEPHYKRSLAIREKALGSDHSDVATSLNNLAVLHQAQGQYAQAEPLYKRSLAISEKTFGPESTVVASNLHNLAALYQAQGQFAQAEPLFKRSLTISEKTFGPEHPDVASTLNYLAGLYESQGQYAQAEPLFKRSLAIWEKTLGPEHPIVATSLNNLAALYESQNKYAQAEPLYKRSLAISEKALGQEHPDVAAILSNLAAFYHAKGRYAQAEPLFKRSLAIFEKILDTEHPSVATSHSNLAVLYDAQGRSQLALSSVRRASAIYRNRVLAGGTSGESVREANANRSSFQFHLQLLKQAFGRGPSFTLTNESFEIVQLAQANDTAGAVAKMAARFGKGDDALAVLAKRKQDSQERLELLESSLVKTFSESPEKRDAVREKKLREDVEAAKKEIASGEAELTKRFPEYQELVRPEPITVAQTQKLLKPGEAMLVYAVDEKQGYAWVVTSSKAAFLPLDIKRADLEKDIALIRSQMEIDKRGAAPTVSVDVLQRLHQQLFTPALPYLADVKHIMVVPSGPLVSLPFGMLVASSPAKDKAQDYASIDWLVKRYATSVLPSVSSIRAFRQFAKPGTAQEPFTGFGDPVIGDERGNTRGTRRTVEAATLFGGTTKSAGLQAGAEVADVAAIRKQPRLADTSDELLFVARALKAKPEQSLWLRDRATETNLKKADLSKYRVLAFATHGVLAGQINGVGEPGLILTPPAVGTVEDDGYLAAGEIAKLKLNADWVILSACNTAAGDGTAGAEGFSGLAKAFFYAGSRSLLVSHWPVASQSTVRLVGAMLQEYEANPNMTKTEAQRKSILALMADPEFAHPAYWAPFVVVGEGGR